MIKHITAFFLTMSIPFLSTIQAAASTNDTSIYKEIRNDSYGNHFTQKVDVYLPAGRSASSTKVLILLHGGAWNSGDKTSINDFVKLIQNKNPDLAILNANYRLAGPSVHLAEQLEDVQQVLKYAVTKSSTWNVSPDRTALGGISAGAHIAMLYAYKYDVAQKVKAVISIVGPANFGDTYYTNNPFFQPLAANLLGKPLTDTSSYLDASPAHVVTAAAPPTYMAYGGYDPLVPATNAVFLDKRLTELKVPHQYNLYANEGHHFSPATYDAVAKNVVAFLKKYQ